MANDNLIINRLRSIKYAFNGALALIKTESSIKIQVVFALLMTALGLYYNISTTEWIVQIMAIGLVITAEGLNTAIEKMADFIHPEHDNKIGLIKDISAGAVFIAAISASVIGLFIYFPKIF